MESSVIGWRPIGLSTEHGSPRAMSPSGQLAFHIPSKWQFNVYPATRISALITRRSHHRTEINVKFVRRNIPKSSSQIFKARIAICPSNTLSVTKVNMLNLLAPELFFFIWAHPVYKMWITQEPNTLKWWNKLHFEEKKRRVYTKFKIFSTYICWINI